MVSIVPPPPPPPALFEMRIQSKNFFSTFSGDFDGINSIVSRWFVCSRQERISNRELTWWVWLVPELPWIRAFGYTRARRGKGKKALGNCVPNCVLLIAHVTTPYVHLPLGAFPRYLQIRAVDFTPAVYFTVCYITQQHWYMSMSCKFAVSVIL